MVKNYTASVSAESMMTVNYSLYIQNLCQHVLQDVADVFKLYEVVLYSKSDRKVFKSTYDC